MGLKPGEDQGFWDDLQFETRREDERAPEWRPEDDEDILERERIQERGLDDV